MAKTITYRHGIAALEEALRELKGWLVVAVVDDSKNGSDPLAVCSTLGTVDADGPDNPEFYHVGKPPGVWAPFLPHQVDSIEHTRGNTRAIIRVGRLYCSTHQDVLRATTTIRVSSVESFR